MVVFHMHKSGICVYLGIAVAILPANRLLSVVLHPTAIQQSQFIPLPNDFRLMVPAAFFHFNALRLDFRIELFQSFLNLSRGQISLRAYQFFQPCLDFLKLFADLL